MILLPSLGLVTSLLMLPCDFSQAIELFASLLLAEGLVYGMYSAINTSYMRTTYGQRFLATNTGISAVVLAPFNLLFPFIAACIFSTCGAYDAFFMLIPLCALGSLLCAIANKHAIERMLQRSTTKNLELAHHRS